MATKKGQTELTNLGNSIHESWGRPDNIGVKPKPDILLGSIFEDVDTEKFVMRNDKKFKLIALIEKNNRKEIPFSKLPENMPYYTSLEWSPESLLLLNDQEEDDDVEISFEDHCTNITRPIPLNKSNLACCSFIDGNIIITTSPIAPTTLAIENILPARVPVIPRIPMIWNKHKRLRRDWGLRSKEVFTKKEQKLKVIRSLKKEALKRKFAFS